MDENRTTELNSALEGIWDSLTDEQKEKAKACRSMDELAMLAGSAGIERPDEILGAVAGGTSLEDMYEKRYCPLCKKKHKVFRSSSGSITPAGEGTTIFVDSYLCDARGWFYLSSARNMYYDEKGNPLGSVVSSNGC